MGTGGRPLIDKVWVLDTGVDDIITEFLTEVGEDGSGGNPDIDKLLL